jgi:hypothetical protein
MSKWLATSAALAIATILALPAGAAERNASGVRSAGLTDISAARRHHRAVRVVVRPHSHWRGPYYGRDYFVTRHGRYPESYRPHPYDLYAQSRPYFVPGGPPVGNAPFGAGTGAYGFGTQ